MKRIYIVIGTRPQFIKFASISKIVYDYFDIFLTDTGQHYSQSLSESFLSEFKLKTPNLIIDSLSSSVNEQIAKIIIGLDKSIQSFKPDYILCFGDTNSSLSAALVAQKLEIPLIHIEAGERNYDNNINRVPINSIQEESNRFIIDSIARILYCSSERGVNHLKEEKNAGKIFNYGDITYDLFLKNFKSAFQKKDEILNKYNLSEANYIYCTIHRALNTDNFDRLNDIFAALKCIEKKKVLPLHPRTKKMLIHFGLYDKLIINNNILLLEPIPYLESIILNSNSYFTITDSGGVTRESYFCNKKSIYIDDTTEWIDLYMDGWMGFAGANKTKIIEFSNDSKLPYKKINYFGDGDASDKIIQSLIEKL